MAPKLRRSPMSGSIHMRVLEIVEATTAGVARHLQTFITHVDQRRFTIAFACPPRRDISYGDDHFVDHVHATGITVYPVAMRRAIIPTADMRSLGALLQLVRHEQFDLVHTHSSKAGFLGQLAVALAGGGPSVHTPHGLYFLGLRPGPRRRFFCLLDRMIAQLSDRVIAVSAGEQATLLRHRVVAARKLVCIENGITAPYLPTHDGRRAERSALDQSGDGLLIGTVARMTAQKNPFMFVDAAAIVLRTLPDSRFVWCGSGDLFDAVQARVRSLGIEHACRLLGHRDDAGQVTAALDLFWLTSDYEGMSCALLEAMALHVPIAATSVMGTADLLGPHSGVLIPPGDAAALAEATLMLARDPDRRRTLAEVAYLRFAEVGTADRMARAMEQLYERTVALRRS